MKRGPRTHRKRLTAEGLPVEANNWTPADWQDLHEAIQRVKANVRRRHAEADDDVPGHLGAAGAPAGVVPRRHSTRRH